jgi:hypothetical protein
MSSQTRISALKALAASALLLIAVGVAPAAAEVIKRGCSPPCRSGYAPAITVPDGWSGDPTVEDRAAPMQILVPAGNRFIESDRIIWASASPKRADQTIADYIKSIETFGNRSFPGIRFVYLPDLPRGNGKEPFHLLLSEQPDGKFSLRADTLDTDSDGNSYIVTIWLSADGLNTLNVAMPSYQKVLLTYG